MVFDPFDDESEDRDPGPEGAVRDPGEKFGDPEEKFADPDHDSLTIPRVDVEESDTPSDSVRIPSVSTAETGAPNDLLETFWVLVLVLNGAILALSLGAMFLLFEGDATRGGWLLAIGLVLTGFSVRRYGQFERVATETTTPSDADGRTETDNTNETNERVPPETTADSSANSNDDPEHS